MHAVIIYRLGQKLETRISLIIESWMICGKLHSQSVTFKICPRKYSIIESNALLLAHGNVVQYENV
jgi:hypothetical protein